MESLSKLERRSPTALVRAPWHELTTSFVALLVVSICMLAAVLIARRLAFALAAGHAVWLLCAIASAAAFAAAPRLAWFLGRPQRTSAGDAAVVYLPLAALVAIAAVLSSAGATLPVAAVLWLIAAGEEFAVLRLLGVRLSPATEIRRLKSRLSGWRPLRPPGARDAAGPASQGPRAKHAPHEQHEPLGRVRPQQAAQEPISGSARAGGTAAGLAGSEAAAFVQTLERVQSVEGCDVLAGTTTMRLEAGQATALLHVAFCPPFAAVPEVDCRLSEGPTLRLKIGQVLPHGARIEMKLAQAAAEPVKLVLAVRASYDPHRSTPTPT